MKILLFQRVASIFPALFAIVLLVIFTCSCGSDTSDSTSATTLQPAPPATSATPASSQPASRVSLTLAASSQAASKGSQVCVPVMAKDFTAILSMQFTMKWDKDVLKFKEVKGFNLPDLSAQNFGMQGAG
ncbi:MAG: cohesin domain-containing protein, partial [Bacteroidota bacterium]